MIHLRIIDPRIRESDRKTYCLTNDRKKELKVKDALLALAPDVKILIVETGEEVTRDTIF